MIVVQTSVAPPVHALEASVRGLWAAHSLPRREPMEVAAELVRNEESGPHRAGRRAARRALGARSGPLNRQVDGSVEWPADCVGSIAHTDTVALAVCVSPAAGGWRIGLDLESTADVRRANLQGWLLDPVEMWVVEQVALTRSHVAAIVFTAKEAAWKSLASQDQRLGSFETIRLLSLGSCGRLVRLTLQSRSGHLATVMSEMIGDLTVSLATLPRSASSSRNGCRIP